ncbi:aldehyde dehydrogenase family protein [Streptomyces sp. NPDC002688]|uniref:aldehyde dehydrogenase family protein n=1 Tax=Streptomyces sp. NPDC002688 TaxID=3154423 RepID=UPI00331EB325
MADFTMTIDGERVTSAGTFGVVNPATGEVWAEAPDCSPGQLDEALLAAQAAQPGWAADLAARRTALHAAADLLMARVGEIAPVLTAEQGKPLKEAAEEVFGFAYWLKYYADLPLPREILQDDESALVEVVRRPVGVVAAITPWNFPLVLASWKVAPALLAGNTVVLKPSPYTPLATLKAGEVLAEVLPAGVLNVVSGGDELGAGLAGHEIPRKISFTGSVATGKSIAAAAAPDLKRLTLELGGNDPAILLDDVDPAEVADRLFAAAFANNGQVCAAVKRVYAPRSLYGEVVEALADRARRARVGDGTHDGVALGPVNNRRQLDRVTGLVERARAGGARLLAGKAPTGGGYFFPPTIVDGAVDGDGIVDEEQFGPALPVVPYTDVEDALARANGTTYGLAGSVWGTDTDRAAAVAERLECGTAWVNTHFALGPHQPFGGHKWSGVGTENGVWGYHSFTDLQVLHRAKA